VAAISAAPAAHLDKYQRLAIVGNDVEFAEPGAEIAADYRVAGAREVLNGPILGTTADDHSALS
jgi:hypothetical protein